MQKSWHLNRRTFLRGTGVALSLPWLESMSKGSDAAESPVRMASVYFPFGVSLPGDKSEHADWNWFPKADGDSFAFRNSLKSLEPLRKSVTVLGGLSHPAGRKMGGHDTGDIFLTGASYRGSEYLNSISLDQFVAKQIGQKTRFGSLVMSSDGGVGEPTRTTTLSYTQEGRPIPALSSPRQIFDRMFGVGDATSKAKRRLLENTGSILDLVLENSRSMKNRLGKQDQRKLDEYLSSVRDIEERVERSQAWLDIPKPSVDEDAVNLAVDQSLPVEYMQAMYDLVFLAFQTDSTRLATYMLGQVAGATTIANAFPACIGLQGNWHGLAHGAGKKDGAEKLGRFDQLLTEQLARFLTRLSETEEREGTMLDNTLVFYGSSNSKTHNNNNYPLVLAGGNTLGFKHNQYLRFGADTPLANVFVTMLDRMGIEHDGFADSTGDMSELLA
ncbi:MAG: hypothetical protein CMP22_06440 [Rickettsiales bacterium]|nr:hypothetical protein [Rickettsiales bacterium]|tara:strand:- start:3322 stop:4650 length:1329 start_codon:yes stop_codon:yes gene_type:complete